MNKDGFSREAVPAPELSDKPETVPNPDTIERVPQSKPPAWVWMILLVVAVIGLMVLLWRSGARMPFMGGFGGFGLIGIMSVAMLFRNRGGGNKNNRPAAVNYRRAAYLRGMDELRDTCHEHAAAQVREIAYHHPDPEGSLLTLVGTPRMWERRPSARNFGHVRMGMGMTRLHNLLEPPNKVPPPEYRETVTAIAARDFLLTQNVVHDVARPLHLFDEPGWAFFAEPQQREVVQGMLRALVAQLCTFHGPDDVAVAIVTDDLPVWEWAKWLPHTADAMLIDASGPARLIFASVGEFMERFGAELASRSAWAPRLAGATDPQGWLVVVVDYPGASCAPMLGDGGYAGLSVLEATGDEGSVLANRATAFQVDELGNVLKAEKRD